MRKTLIILLLVFSMKGMCFEPVSDQFLVTYGNKNAPIKITEYFSFYCPHCVALFRKDFKEIKKAYLENDKVYWVFHPVPMDLITVQAMNCLEKLTDKQKQIFLEVVLEELDIENQEITTLMMKRAMELFDHPIPDMDKEEYVETTRAFEEAFKFISQEEKIIAVPSVALGDEFMDGYLPDISFVKKVMENLEIRK